MISHKSCPGKRELSDLIAGRLASAAEAETVRHVEHCENCQRAVEQLGPSRNELLPPRAYGAELQLETREQALRAFAGRKSQNEPKVVAE